MQHKHPEIDQAIDLLGRSAGKKILFASVPADGHFNPLTGIAMHLKSLGYDVRWYNSMSYAGKLKKLDIPFYPFKKALEVTGTNIDEIFPERASISNSIRKLNFDLQHFFILRSSEYYADIKEIHESFPFDLMIADCVFTAIPFVKEKMKIPVISVGVVPLFESSVDLAPAGLAMTPARSIAGRLAHRLLHFISNAILFKSSNDIFRTILDEHGIENKGMNGFDILVKRSSLLLQSGTPGFEYQRSDLGKNIRFIGSLLPVSACTARDQWFDERLTRYQRVVLVTQGTVEKNPEKIIVPVLEAYKNTDTLVIATTGGSQTKQLKERFPEDNIIIEDFIPFDDVMPYADVYVTNGGYGGVMLGIEHKLPLVVAGVHEGKNEINARIGYFRLGINLKRESPNTRQVRNAIEEVLQNDLYKKNVVALGNEFRQYDTNHLCATYVKELLQPSKVNLRVAFKQFVNN